jgi:hypothetical protein
MPARPPVIYSLGYDSPHKKVRKRPEEMWFSQDLFFDYIRAGSIKRACQDISNMTTGDQLLCVMN